MNEIDVADGLVRLAKSLVVADTKKSKYAMLRGLREAQHIVAEVTGMKVAAAAPRITIEELPGLSPQQVHTAMDRIVDIRQKLQQLVSQYQSVVDEIGKLEGTEKEGIEFLKSAAREMKQKGKFLVEAENSLLEFTAYFQDKRPGVEQMIGDPAASDFGEKAGAFFQRVGEKLGKQMAEAVAKIYVETENDLTHAADAIKLFKVVAKASPAKQAALKKAGLSDLLLAAKEWLSGRADAVAQRFLNFAGDIKKWARGFKVRTEIVERGTKDLTKALNEAKKSIASAIA